MKKVKRNLFLPAIVLALSVPDKGLPLNLFSQQAETLPVSWIYVKTKQTACNTNVIRWATMAEPENCHFIIERSEDGNAFAQIETLPGYGPGGNNYYRVSDKKVQGKRKVYYRIGLWNADGKVEYSPTVVVRMKEGHCVSVQLFPNPARESIYFEAGNGKGQTADLSVTDLSGKIYCSRNVRLLSGRILAVSVASWPSGIYLLNIIDQDGSIIANRYFLKQ